MNLRNKDVCAAQQTFRAGDARAGLRSRALTSALAFVVCLATFGAMAVGGGAGGRVLQQKRASSEQQKRASDGAAQKPAVRAEVRAALARISADSLRGHLSFIASDALEGRRAPSRGLDLAAEYIAAQFRRAGLEPIGDDGYFQTATWADAVAGSRRIPTPAPEVGALKVRNVAGVLRGSDPALKDTYVLVTAHYDHLGVRAEGEGDRIFNGANDDGSGSVSVVELASVLSTLKQRPRRSIIFMTFFGEEEGLIGSRYYGRHPLVPLSKTVAQVNLEQVGRTDDSEGPQVGTLAVTGFDYSDVSSVLRTAGTLTGINIYGHPTKSDAFFSRSDNQALADLGVPAHTFSVAFEFPDYHRAGDEWQKIDFDNMAKVLRAVGLGVVLLADNPQPPRWNEQNPKAARYLQAWRELNEGKGPK